MMWKKPPRENDDDPIKRIFNTILQYAVKEEVREIRIALGRGVPIEGAPEGNEAVAVSYLFGDEWKRQMIMPGYVHADLLSEIRRRAAMEETQTEGEIAMPLRDESDNFSLMLRAVVEMAPDKTTRLRLRFADSATDFSQN